MKFSVKSEIKKIKKAEFEWLYKMYGKLKVTHLIQYWIT